MALKSEDWSAKEIKFLLWLSDKQDLSGTKKNSFPFEATMIPALILIMLFKNQHIELLFSSLNTDTILCFKYKNSQNKKQNRKNF